MAGQMKLISPDGEEPAGMSAAPFPVSAISGSTPFSANASLSPSVGALPGPAAIDQVRELLYGDALRSHGRRVEDVQKAVDALEQRILRRLADVQASVDSLGQALRKEQSGAIRQIGATIVEMGRQISAMGEFSDRGDQSRS